MSVSQLLKKVSGLLLTLLVVMSVALASSSTQAKTDTVIITQNPGLLFGVGNDFQITDSEYLNVSVASSERIELYIQSIPQVITLALMPSLETPSTQLTIEGLTPHHTYYKYEDDFHNLVEFQTDELGTYSFTQDIGEPHALFIQEDTSTLFLKIGGGGDCAAIGTWDQSTLTCTLTQDVTDTIQIDSSGLTLNGGGYTLSRGNPRLHTAVLIRASNVTVENLAIDGFIRGIFINRARNNTIVNNAITDTTIGILLLSAHQNSVTGNTIAVEPINNALGLELLRSNDNQIAENDITGVMNAIQLLSRNNRNTISGNSVTAESTGLYFNARSDNNIAYGNDIYVPASRQPTYIQDSVGNIFSLAPPTGGNYWTAYDETAEGCVDNNDDGFCDDPFVFPGGQDEYPYVNPINEEQPGNSNVLFLPGFQGSRLYRQGILSEDELWIPSTNQDAEQLFLNDAGESIDPGIYTRDIIDRTKFLFPIYEDFIRFMDEDMVAGGVINEWRAFPYDWRFAVDDIADQPELQQTLQELAASSASGKVTIIAHSNGGLVAKLLLNDPAVAEKVDRLIMVATPQLGTPATLTALLHGDGQNLLGGFLVTKETARELGENMPGAFGLLPSDEYFSTVADPVIQFTEEVANNYDFRGIYGEAVDTFDELFAFLAGDNDIRSEPADDDTDSPNVLNVPLLTQARDLHANTLDNWAAPENIEVVQIAGWGLDTIYAIEYDNCDFCPFGQGLSNLDRKALQTIAGDGTVVTPSAFIGDFKKYFLNVLEFNKDNFINHDHANILEINSLQNLLTKIITDDLSTLPTYISEVRPNPLPGDIRHRLRMKSPVAVHVSDSSGRHTGLINNPDQESDLKLYEEQIPNSSYFELGEKKYIGLDSRDIYTIKLDAEGTGTFTLEIDTVRGDEVVETIVYNNIPVTSELTGELTLEQEPMVQPELRLDFEGDGEVDAIVPANGSLPPQTSVKLLRQAVKNTEINSATKAALLLRISAIERLLEHRLTHPADQLLRNLDRFIEHLTNRNRGIAQENALPLREIIAAVQEAL